MGRRRWLFRLILIGFGLSGGFLAAELGLRLIGISFPLFYYPDRYVGARLRPGFEGWYTKEGRAIVQVNAAGFRDRPRSVQKASDVYRIAVLGDSFVEALQVPFEQAYTTQLANQLQASGQFTAGRVEVLNFGVSGHGTAQQLEMLRHHVAPYQPDLVILAIFPGNDIRNNSSQIEPDPVRPFYHLHEGELRPDYSFRQHPLFLKSQTPAVKLKVDLINRSRVLQLVNEWRNRPRAAARQEGDSKGELGLDYQVFREPTEDAWREAWRITEHLLAEIHRQTLAQGADLLLVIIPSAGQVHPETDTYGRKDQKFAAVNWDYADQRLVDIADRLEVPVLRLQETFRQYADEHEVFLYGFPNTQVGTGHWNSLGQRVAAAATAVAIERLRLKAEPRSTKRGSPLSPG